MPASYILSASHERASVVADLALKTPEGVSLPYTIDNCKSFAAAKIASKRFQTAFCTMRLRERRRIQRGKGESTSDNLSDTRGPYDVLACFRTPLPNGEGFEIRVTRSNMIDVNIPIIDVATGLPIENFTEKSRMLDVLMDLMLKEDTVAVQERRTIRNPFSRGQVEWILANDPESVAIFKDSFGVDITQETA